MRQDKLDALAHEIAVDDSQTVLRSVLPTVRYRGVEWRDSSLPYPLARREARRAARYLEARGLLIRHRTQKHLVRWEA